MTLPDFVNFGFVREKCKKCRYLFVFDRYKKIICDGKLMKCGYKPIKTSIFDKYKEKSMENNEKFEEWIEGNNFITGILKTTKKEERIKEYLKNTFEAGQESMKPTTFKASDIDLPNNRSGEIKKSDYPELTKVMEGIGDHQTPNCQLCKWAGAIHALFGSEYRHICNAQAGKGATEVYNNEQCQVLYEVEESEK